ncbi:unnamed protein product [Polarella glacialis]|uniref:Uncharacterized protein n=1 Tax=Polarella glacialis TaxID=89957 RepID=A0A813EXU1_POLGL|nr:unnamed protein product [Polarella glacialis]
MSSSSGSPTALPTEACFRCSNADATSQWKCRQCSEGGYNLCARCSDVWCCPRCHQVAGQEDFAPNSTFEDQTESLHSSGASSSRRRGPQESGSEQGRLARLERRVAELELERYRRTPLSVQRLVLGVLVFFSRWVRRLRGRPDTRSPL